MRHGKHSKLIQLPQSRGETVRETLPTILIPAATIILLVAFVLVIAFTQVVKDAYGEELQDSYTVGTESTFAQEVIYDVPTSTKYMRYSKWDDPTNRAAKERLLHEYEKNRAKQVIEAIQQMKAQKEAEEAEARAAEEAAAQQYYASTYYEPSYSYIPSSDYSSLYSAGVQYDENYRYTWYSQNVLPGGGLNIPGRHVGAGGYVMDGDDNICVASSDLPKGTQIDTPYGAAKVYDSGCASGTIDVYTNW